VTFGLGPAETVEQVTVTWPDGQQVILTDVPANETLEVAYPDASP